VGINKKTRGKLLAALQINSPAARGRTAGVMSQ